jgi:tetratricopeptide (TPR) repeat protein
VSLPALRHAALALALGAAAAGLAHRIRVAEEKPYDVRFVPSAGSLRWLSLGHPTLAANLTWLKAVQYVGERRGDERGWGKLRPLLEVVTDLDPRHGYAYQVGANMLSSVGLTDDANAILEKGIRAVPDRYILPFHRGVNAFLYEGDHQLAGRYFELAARTPGAPEHLRDYVLAQYAMGDAADAAISFLRQLHREAKDDESRRSIERQIVRATLEQRANALEAAAERYRARVGVAPVALAQLVHEGIVRRIPEDPFGGELYLDGHGRVRSTVEPRRFEPEPEGEAREAGRARAWARLKALEGSVR